MKFSTQTLFSLAVLGLLASATSVHASKATEGPARSRAQSDTVVHFVDAPLGEGSPMVLVAEIEWDGGKVGFIDETIGHIFGFGLLEQGNADLAPFYEQGASALEIFLALAPDGTEVPLVLYRAHELARELDPGVPAEPRRLSTDFAGGLSADKSISYYTFSNDTGNCWGWGGVGAYNQVVGNEGAHSSIGVGNSFRTWTGISWVFGQTSNGTYLDEIAESGDQYYPAPWGNERGFAMCVPYAVVQPGENSWECTVPDGTYENTVRYRVYLRGEQAGQSPWSAGPIELTGYGEGLRYRSSTSADRKYTLEVRDLSEKSLICKERFEVFWRNRNIGSTRPGDITL